MQLQPDSWLLPRLSPNTMVQNVRTHNSNNNNNNNNKYKTLQPIQYSVFCISL